MNDNYIFNRYNNYNKNIIELSPRTHISVCSSKNKNENLKNSKNKQANDKIKKYDSVEIGLNKLITLGRQTKKFIPSKESILNRKQISTVPDCLKNKLCKLTPFQVYEKNKKLIAISLKKNSQKTLNLKSFNSEEFTNNNNENIKKLRNSNIFITPIKHYNTITCNFKNKLIKSLLEKDKVKIQTINDKIEFGYNNPKSISTKYILSYENNGPDKAKVDKDLNDYYIGKDKMMPILYKGNQKKKKRKEYNIHSSDKILSDFNLWKNKNKISYISNYKDICNNIYSKIPLVQLNTIHFSNTKLDNIIINKIYNKYKKT